MVDSQRRTVPGRSDRKTKEGGGRKGTTAAGREFVDLVVAYAKQETLGPLRGLGRFIGFGVSGSVFLALGLLILLLAMLRALQTETGSTFRGNLSWAPYLITAAVALAVLGLSAWRITKTPPTRTSGGDGEDKP
jgi:Putative Actinobacterial Holin-X, holin superfamily III